MAPNSDFEFHYFNPFSVNKELQRNEIDSNTNYCLDKISSLDTKYYALGEVKKNLKSLQLNSFKY